MEQCDINRRRLLLGAGCLLAGSLLPVTVLASQTAPVRKLRLYNPNTGERISAAYWENGQYDQSILKEFSHLMRDYRANQLHNIDPKLFDQLFELQRKLGSAKEIHVICGYRSPHTNSVLRSKSKGVAKKSLHMTGQAIDLAMPGVNLARVRQAALSLKAGGVGYYPRSGFVHLDTGQIRHW